LYIGHQRRAFGQVSSTLKERGQREPWPRGWRGIGRVFAAQEQALQTLGQVLAVQGLGQVRRWRQRQDLAHACAVVAAAHQDERQRGRTVLLAQAAQNAQAVDPWQLPVSDDQIVGVTRQQLQGLPSLVTGVHPGIATHARQDLFKQLPGRWIGLGDQHTRYSR
jgi:hypothetical protein